MIWYISSKIGQIGGLTLATIGHPLPMRQIQAMPGVLTSTMAMTIGTIRAIAIMSGALEQESER